MPQYGTLRDRERVKSELDGIRKIEGDAYKYGRIEDKANFQRNKGKLEGLLSSIEPPPIKDDAERARLRGREQELESYMKGPCAEIGKPDMPTKHEMWESPAGAVGKHRKWEHCVTTFGLDADGKPAKAGKGDNVPQSAFDEWKDTRRRLYSDEEEFDPDIANIERFRPQTRGGASADYPRLQFAPGAGVSQERWDESVGPKEPIAAAPKPESEKIPSRKCKAVKSSGEQCKGWAMSDNDYCRHHADALVAQSA